jgi:hypothetical protein
VVDGLDADIRIARRGEEFELMGLHGKKGRGRRKLRL